MTKNNNGIHRIPALRIAAISKFCQEIATHDEMRLVSDLIRSRQRQLAAETLNEFTIGDLVSFESRKKHERSTLVGVIERLGVSRVHVRVTSLTRYGMKFDVPNQKWAVSPSLLTLIKKG